MEYFEVRYGFEDDGDVESGPHLTWDGFIVEAPDGNQALRMITLELLARGVEEGDVQVEQTTKEQYIEYARWEAEQKALESDPEFMKFMEQMDRQYQPMEVSDEHE